MRHAGFVVAGALLGVAFVFVMPFLSAWLSPPTADGAPFSYDEANRQLKVFVLVGGGLFAALGAWIGHTAATRPRAAWAMAAAVLLATAALKLASTWWPVPAHTAQALAAVLSGWALCCALLCAGAPRWLGPAQASAMISR
jgi:uncharacterized membrane protein